MSKLTVADFEGYFQELHDPESENRPKPTPYDWQERLAAKAVDGTWPQIIDLPTGSGKTACLDVALFALACQSALPLTERTAPRRIFFCVNRRVIVDEAHRRAVGLAKAIWQAEREANGAKPVLTRVAAALRMVSGVDDPAIPPLDVLELRGGIYRDNRWARTITQPTIVCTTIDQLGSRLLFRGYGVSSGASPIQAAMIAYDSLVLLDEAHISRPFLQSLQWVEKYLDPEKWAEQPIGVQRVKVVPMTATPPEGTSTADVIRLEDKDRQNNHLDSRLTSNKPAVLKSDENVIDAAVSEATDHAKDSAVAIGVIVNRVATAKEIYRQLRVQHPESVVELVIGSMRPVDRDRQADRLQSLVGPDRPKKTEQTSFVVATQCLEVGADYDFDVLITECASLDALRQRFGRLNRGGRPIAAKAAILIDEKQIKVEGNLDDKKPLDSIYGNSLSRSWNWLWEYAEVTSVEADPSASDDGQPKKRKQKFRTIPTEVRLVNFGIDSFNSLLAEHGDDSRIPADLLSPSSKLDAPVMLPAYIDLWCQTNPQPVPDPDVSLFIHGLQEGARDVQVCWRADLIEDEHLKPNDWPDVVSLLPPTAAECMSVPIRRLRRWLLSRPDVLAEQSDLLVTHEEEGEEKGQMRTPCVLWKGAKESANLKSVNELYPGCTVVLPASAQGWGELGHIPELQAPEAQPQGESDEADEESASGDQAATPATECLTGIDVAESAFRQSKDRAALRLHPVLKPLVQGYPAAQCALDRIADVESPPSTGELRRMASNAMRESLDGSGNDVPAVQWELYPDGRGLVITTRKRLNQATDWYLPSLDDGGDEPSRILRRRPVSLPDHTQHVTVETEGSLRKLPLQPFEVTFGIAVELHDWGKADERFQAMLRRSDRSDAWLYAGVTSSLLAKSDGMPQTRAESEAARIRAGLPKGFRHEMLSVQLAEKAGKLPDDPAQQEFILHLIAAHHGYARPFAPVVGDDDPPDVSVDDVCLRAADRTATPAHRVDSGIADRFWALTKRYGWWGLAYLEAVLRLADQQASAKENEGQYPDQAQELDANNIEVQR